MKMNNTITKHDICYGMSCETACLRLGLSTSVNHKRWFSPETSWRFDVATE
ncbi:hypothetical protein G3567_10770 [Psychroflexus sp. YR1-1]|uniref:Uncharacterized protein n=1 Tax=Psychroflexus aurantiacus TaxID=2709310 RepID=A0A6B3R1V0_9FLAO|nr:hypothetical protein [Psychroflexus aurantiacus]NEV94626.1 hypothetical protein [Psychroflexus aurantiacus]